MIKPATVTEVVTLTSALMERGQRVLLSADVVRAVRAQGVKVIVRDGAVSKISA